MTQNTSSAVMAQRREAKDSLDDFPTPPWATRALCEWLDLQIPLRKRRAWEPAANRGHMVRPLSEYFESVLGTDVHDYGAGFDLRDFLVPYRDEATGFDWIITNPPYRLGLEFAHRALDLAEEGSAMFLRLQWLEGEDRFRALFSRSHRRPSAVLIFSERVPLFRSVLRRKGDVYHATDPKTGEPVQKRAETATAYAWFVWFKLAPAERTFLDWIPPCREKLERPGDYPDAMAEGAA